MAEIGRVSIRLPSSIKDGDVIRLRTLLVRADFIRQLGSALFFPNAIGWAGAMWCVAALMICWYLLSAWNEQKRQVGVLKV